MQTTYAAWRAGDTAAFDTLYTALSVPVFTLAARMLGDRAQAEDITQEAFIKLLSATGVKIDNPRAWLYRVVRNLAVDHLRKQTPDELPDEHPASGSGLENVVGTRVDVENAMTALTPAERAVVTLHLNGGLPFREVADVVDSPLGTVLWRYRKALHTLRNKLEGESQL